MIQSNEIRSRTVAELIEILNQFPKDAIVIGSAQAFNGSKCHVSTDLSQIFGYPHPKTDVIDQVAIHFWSYESQNEETETDYRYNHRH